MKTNHQVLQALLALSLATAVLPAAAEAADDWLKYRLANGLPVNPVPSRPDQLTNLEVPVPEAAKIIAKASGNGNGNGNGNGHGNGNGGHHSSRPCGDFFVELAKTDGDTTGEAGRCE